MCRILATWGKWERDDLTIVLEKFGALAESGTVPKSVPSGHKDGWGLVAYRDKKVAFYEKSPEAATDNPRFGNAINQIVALNPSIVVGHLRKASVGGIKFENTHPFVAAEWTFCHNGRIGTKEDMDRFPLDQKYRGKVRGDTDSEVFFLYLLQLLSGTIKPDSSTIQGILLDAIDLVRSTYDYTAINSIFTNGNILLAVRETNESNVRVKEENLCEYYYTLLIGRSADRKTGIICSQRLELKDITWTEIPNHMIAVINLEADQNKVFLVSSVRQEPKLPLT